MWATNSALTFGMHHCCFTLAFYDLALEAGVAKGYRGKGVVYVFAVGSDASWCAYSGSVQLWVFSFPWDDSITQKQTEPFYHIYGRFDTLFPRKIC